MFNETDWTYEEVELHAVPDRLRKEIAEKLDSGLYESAIVKRIEKATLVAEGEVWWNAYLEVKTVRDNWFFYELSYCAETDELFSERLPLRSLQFSSLFQNKCEKPS